MTFVAIALPQAEQRSKKRIEIESRRAAGLGDPEPSAEEVRTPRRAALRQHDRIVYRTVYPIVCRAVCRAVYRAV